MDPRTLPCIGRHALRSGGGARNGHLRWKPRCTRSEELGARKRQGAEMRLKQEMDLQVGPAGSAWVWWLWAELDSAVLPGPKCLDDYRRQLVNGSGSLAKSSATFNEFFRFESRLSPPRPQHGDIEWMKNAGKLSLHRHPVVSNDFFGTLDDPGWPWMTLAAWQLDVKGHTNLWSQGTGRMSFMQFVMAIDRTGGSGPRV